MIKKWFFFTSQLTYFGCMYNTTYISYSVLFHIFYLPFPFHFTPFLSISSFHSLPFLLLVSLPPHSLAFSVNCDLKVSSSQAKIDENFANYFIKTKAIMERATEKHKWVRLINSRLNQSDILFRLSSYHSYSSSLFLTLPFPWYSYHS